MHQELDNSLKRAFLQIPSACNNNCSYCKKDIVSTCWVCTKHENKQFDVREEYIKLIKQLFHIGCRQITLHGENVLGAENIYEFLSKQQIMLLNKALILEDNSKINLDELKYMCKQDVDYNVYSFMQNYNTCLYSTIAINSNLEILPCPRMTNRILGKLDRENLDINKKFTSKINLEELWFMKKENIDKCKKCSRRYLCLECRQIEEKVTKRHNGKRNCVYLDDKEECK